MNHVDFLDEMGWIRKEMPLWWDLDFNEDPREEISFDEFEKRLVDIGNYPLSKGMKSHPVKIYQEEKVPVSILDVDINGVKIPIFISVRPSTYDELFSFDSLGITADHGLTILQGRGSNEMHTSGPERKNELIRNAVKEGLDIKGHWPGKTHIFLPHTRGYFKEKRGNKIIYYRPGFNRKHLLEGGISWVDAFSAALEGIGKGYILLSDFGPRLSDRIRAVGEELVRDDVILSYKCKRHKSGLKKRKNKHAKVVQIEWDGLKRVVYDDLKQGDEDLASYYPVKAGNLKRSVPVSISNRTHPGGKKGLYAQGIKAYSEYGQTLYVIPFTDEDFASDVAYNLSQELENDFKPIIYEKRPGRGRYRVME